MITANKHAYRFLLASFSCKQNVLYYSHTPGVTIPEFTGRRIFKISIFINLSTQIILIRSFCDHGRQVVDNDNIAVIFSTLMIYSINFLSNCFIISSFLEFVVLVSQFNVVYMGSGKFQHLILIRSFYRHRHHLLDIVKHSRAIHK